MSHARYIYAEPAREVLALFLNNVRLSMHFARSRVGNISVQKPNKNRILANCLEDCFLIFITSPI